MRISKSISSSAIASLALLTSSALAAPIEERGLSDFFNDVTGTIKEAVIRTPHIVLDNNAISHDGTLCRMRMRAQITKGKGNSELIVDAFKSALGNFLGATINSNEESTLVDRTSLFLAPPKKTSVTVQISGCPNSIKVESDEAGNIDEMVDLEGCNNTPVKQLTASTEDGDSVSGSAFSSGPKGFGIISDIDDTIKVTNVLEPKKAIEATFLKDFVAVDSMPELYTHLHQKLSAPLFTYLSGSPNQLVPFLQPFLSKTYPHGQVLTKDVGFSNAAQILNTIGDASTQDYKEGEIDKIKEQFPHKNMVCIGDSGEKDPEVYGASFRKHGGEFIKCIWIREVEGGKNNDQRFSDAFQGVPADRIKRFKDPKELMDIDVAGGKCN